MIAVVGHSQTEQNLWESLVLFLHFLVMAPTLLCFPCAHEFGHTCENSVHSSETAVHKMTVINLQKPMVSFVLFNGPMSEQLVWIFLLIDAHALVLFLLYLVLL